MKTDKLLSIIYDKAKGEKTYYNFNSFKDDAREFIKDVRHCSTVCHITPSKSGLSRRFNFDKYNMLLNICYNEKATWDEVKVDGCGMDMHWHLKFTTCEMLSTKKECEKYPYNSLSSNGKII